MGRRTSTRIDRTDATQNDMVPDVSLVCSLAVSIYYSSDRRETKHGHERCLWFTCTPYPNIDRQAEKARRDDVPCSIGPGAGGPTGPVWREVERGTRPAWPLPPSFCCLPTWVPPPRPCAYIRVSHVNVASHHAYGFSYLQFCKLCALRKTNADKRGSLACHVSYDEPPRAKGKKLYLDRLSITKA